MNCTVNDCDRPALRRGWCAYHYHRWHIGKLSAPTTSFDGMPFYCTCEEPQNGTGIECRHCRRPVRERLQHVAGLVRARQKQMS